MSVDRHSDAQHLVDQYVIAHTNIQQAASAIDGKLTASSSEQIELLQGIETNNCTLRTEYDLKDTPPLPIAVRLESINPSRPDIGNFRDITMFGSDPSAKIVVFNGRHIDTPNLRTTPSETPNGIPVTVVLKSNSISIIRRS